MSSSGLRLPLAAFTLASAALLGFGTWLFSQPGGALAPAGSLAQSGIGGEFTLTAADGSRVSTTGLKGKPYALYFGFTHCPDVCPTSMFEMAGILKEIGEPARNFRVYFVTVDPARDTPDLLREYTASFDERIVGLTGPEAEIDAVVKAWRAYYKKVPTGGDGYTMDHTALIYLMDGSNRLFEIIGHAEDRARSVAKLRRLLEQRT
jgi:protein SCO1/2